MVTLITTQSGIQAPKSDEMDAVLTVMDDDSNGEISKEEFLDLIMLGMDKMIEMEGSL